MSLTAVVKVFVVLAGLTLSAWPAAAEPPAAQDRFVPVEGLALWGAALPTDAESLAARHFTREFQKLTGQVPVIHWGGEPSGPVQLCIGNRATHGTLVAERGWQAPADSGAASQSYVLDCSTSPSGNVIVAMGLGDTRTPRGLLGLGYALGELLRRLDERDGKWGFVLDAAPTIRTPKMAERTLYLMNSNNCNPNVSLEYFDRAQIEEYVDFLVESRYSRVSLWQWHSSYLYPGNADTLRATNERHHQAMRMVFDYARRRGLEVYHLLTPAHANVDLLPKDPKFAGTGYYGRSGVCWSQPEGRDLARTMAQMEMEYYGPVDGYGVWFYDPAGCFCDQCRPNQAAVLFDQVKMVVDLAKTISPGARFEACLWPTWVFHEYTTRGIPFTKPEAEAMVKEFLAKCLAEFGPRGLTIYDSCESDVTNIYNGLVKPEEFKRNAMMYSVMGMASEHAYVFAPFGLRYLGDKMGIARDRGLEEGLFFIQYAATNTPSVFTFADVLYDEKATGDTALKAYASRYAKGSAAGPFVALLTALEEEGQATDSNAKETAIGKAEAAWAELKDLPGFHANREWMDGYVKVQRCYLELSRTKDKAAFDTGAKKLVDSVAPIPFYSDYAKTTLSQQNVLKLHLRSYWPGFVEPKSEMVGVFTP